MRVVVLDTSAFIQGYNLSPDEVYYTTSEVYHEIREEVARIRYESARLSGRLKENIPSEKYLRDVELMAARMGEKEELSETDKHLVALTLQLKSEGEEVEIISDDYSLQNLASHLGIPFKAIGTRGITRRFGWAIYCPGCHKIFDSKPKDGICPICGTKIKRKPSSKIALKP